MQKNEGTGSGFTLGLSVLMLMALALVASELRSGTDAGIGHGTSPERILFIEAGKG